MGEVDGDGGDEPLLDHFRVDGGVHAGCYGGSGGVCVGEERWRDGEEGCGVGGCW